MLPASDIVANTAALRLQRQAEREAFAMPGETGTSLLARALAIALVDGRALSMEAVGLSVQAAANFVLTAARAEAFDATVQEHGMRPQ